MLVVRLARPEDDSTLAALDDRAWALENAVVPRAEPGHPFFTNFGPDNVLVAELDGAVVGWTKIAPPTPLPSNAHVAQIQGLAVEGSVRRRGVGRALIDAACALARERGARRITLRVLGTNPGARRLYASAGFTVEGVLPEEFLLGGRYVDDVLMGKRL